MKKTIFYHPRTDKAMPYLLNSQRLNRPRADVALQHLHSDKSSAFTLVELIIVISIIAILGTINNKTKTLYINLFL
jgi:prepilin-type N-terminal cleavage/methylation domain-containing protein